MLNLTWRGPQALHGLSDRKMIFGWLRVGRVGVGVRGGAERVNVFFRFLCFVTFGVSWCVVRVG
jgi:hypothetical protein